MLERNLETKAYKLVWGSLQGRGTFIIIRKSDDKTTLCFVCNQGLEDYKRLRRAYNNSRKQFDNLAAKYNYYS